MNIVKELRKKKGIQQKELALTIGVAQPTVSDWENGKKDPSGERLLKLSEYFGVDQLTILGNGASSLENNSSQFHFDPDIDIPEGEQIRQYLIKKLGGQPITESPVPQESMTPEINIVSGAMAKMSKEQQGQVVNVLRAMFSNNPEFFEKG